CRCPPPSGRWGVRGHSDVALRPGRRYGEQGVRRSAQRGHKGDGAFAGRAQAVRPGEASDTARRGGGEDAMTTQATAAVLYQVKQPLVVEDVEVLEPGAHEVLVRWVANGVCHSDLHVTNGD